MTLKIIHTADWHLGQTFFGYDRNEEHDAFLAWLSDTLVEQQADVLLIAGDVFDVANPSAGAQRRFYRFLRQTTCRNPHLQIIVVAGNHDSAARLEAPSPLLEEMNTRIVGIIKRKDDGGIDFDSLLFPLYDREGKQQAWCMAVPFLRQGDYPPAGEEEEEADTYVGGVVRMYDRLYTCAAAKRTPGQAIVAMGHLHASGAEVSADDRSERVIMGGLESVPCTAFHPQIAYTALGHIHKAQRVGGSDAVRYAGSPLPMSFSETHYHHQVVCVELDGEKASRVEPLAVPRLVDLLRIPAKPCPPEEVIESLEALPAVAAGEESSGPQPFVEVRVLLSEPEPSFRHRVEEVLKDKPVRLTSIVPSYPEKEGETERTPLSFGDLQKIDPLDMLKRAFAGKYNAEMPDELQQLFGKVIEELNTKTEKE